MIDEPPTTPLVIRLATPDDISLVNVLDSYSDSPTRDIHREMEKYFGSVDPSTHEKTVIFLAEVEGMGVAKAELMLPPAEAVKAIGYIKRIVVDPQYRKRGLARQLILHIITFARTELHVEAIDLHVWENNFSAIRLYEALGFKLQHRERYYRLPL